MAAREGASSGEHSRERERAGWLEGSAGLACDDVARVTDSGEAEGASLRRAKLYVALDNILAVRRR